VKIGKHLLYLENGQLENEQFENRNLENEEYSTWPSLAGFKKLFVSVNNLILDLLCN